ncbi:MAG: hypothetical protein A2W80_10230 [Candidatus Riflebacteria bacterium GWC2_50_8]|nr:MAG: hypothetical protein A2W80_10230 [Candidatus Riflebacteria bacterium GWC2_50_8]
MPLSPGLTVTGEAGLFLTVCIAAPVRFDLAGTFKTAGNLQKNNTVKNKLRTGITCCDKLDKIK